MSIIISAAALLALAGQSTLTIDFSGFDEPKGQIMFALFDSEASYDGNGAPVRTLAVAAATPAATSIIADLPVGRYAIKAFRDLDGDGKMSVNPVGMPVEPFAFSNNAVGAMGPARWADAAFEVKPGANRHQITIR